MLRHLRAVGTGRSLGGIFRRKGNRRVRTASGRFEVLTAPAITAPARSLGRVLLCVGLATGVAAGALGLRTMLLRGPRFALTDVRVSPLRHVDPAALIARSGLSLGKSLFALDLKEVERRVSREPWVQSVRVRRELPHTIAIDVVEREVRVAVALGGVYLVDEHGDVFKRARAEEVAGLPVVTGLSRERYLADPQRGRSVLRRALELEGTWREHGTRPVLGELHHDGGHDAAAAFTVYFPHAGHPVGVRLGPPDRTTAERLQRLDAVIAALDRQGARAALIHLDQRVQLDRVAVRLAGTDVLSEQQNEAYAPAAGGAVIQAL